MRDAIIIKRYQHGFSLIELLITLTIMAIMAGLIMPSYQQFFLDNYRHQAQIKLTELANMMESHYDSKKGYSLAKERVKLPQYIASHHYRLILQASRQHYCLYAYAAQASKTTQLKEAGLWLNNLSERGCIGSDSHDCWN